MENETKKPKRKKSFMTKLAVEGGSIDIRLEACPFCGGALKKALIRGEDVPIQTPLGTIMGHRPGVVQTSCVKCEKILFKRPAKKKKVQVEEKPPSIGV